MESSKLTERLRGMLRSPAPTGPKAALLQELPGSLEQMLGGQWHQQGSARCFVVERRWAPEATHGVARVGELAARFERAVAHASLLTCMPPRPPLIFFDVETTGLSGGAGTFAFLVGLGSFSADGMFVTRQYVLVKPGDERPMLEMVRSELARAGALVSFNGKSFDAPVLETRYLFNRLDWIGGRLPHLDVLHPARLFWGTSAAESLRSRPRDSEARRASGGGAPREGNHVATGCSLLALEQQVLGVEREDDVPGFEVPSRYFQFLRSGNAEALGPVLEHNRLDLLSLAGLAGRLVRLVEEGPEQARDASEALALGRVYQRAGYERQAADAFNRTLDLIRSAPHACTPAIRIDALRCLALAARRARRYDLAAARWQQLLEVAGSPRHVVREALEALAIHHEHRVRDLRSARTFALGSLEAASHAASAVSARHRLARLERKMADDRGNVTIPFPAF